jgi:hypothetical protein
VRIVRDAAADLLLPEQLHAAVPLSAGDVDRDDVVT